MQFNTPQELFEFVSKHLFNQGEQSLMDTIDIGGCMYRGKNTTSCAVGCVIPDDYYVPAMEGRGIQRLIQEFAVPEYIRDNEYLLGSLQRTHDSSWNWDTTHSMKKQLHKIGVDYSLNTDFLDNLSFKDR